MSRFDRRDFLKIGSSGLVGAALPTSILAAPLPPDTTPRAPAEPVRGIYLLEPGLVSHLDSEGKQVLQQSMWALPPGQERLSSILLSQVALSKEQIEAWQQSKSGGLPLPSELAFMDDLLSIPIGGGSDIMDLSAAGANALRSGRDIDISLDLRLDPKVSSFPGSISTKTGFPSVQIPVSQGEATPKDAFRIPIYWNGWLYQLRGWDIHPLAPCVNQNVFHFNFDIFAPAGYGRYFQLQGWHFGVYRQGWSPCFVLFQPPAYGYVCWNSCGPTWSNLRDMILYALLTSASNARIYLNYWVAVTMAGIGASAFYGVLLAA
jgi:hypothetical protein